MMKKALYIPGGKTGGIIREWINMINSVYVSRELIFRLLLRNIQVRYRQTYLGYLWAILPQVTTVTIFTFLASHRVFAMGETSLPYVIHATWSISVWQLFASSLISCTRCLSNSGTLIKKINFPRETLIFSAVGVSVYDFLVRLLPVLAVFCWYGYVPSVHSLFLPLVLVLVIMQAIGLAFFLSILNLVYRDTENIVSMLMTFGMFLSPILYPPPTRAPFELVNILNPFSPLIITTQHLISGQSLSGVDGIIPVCAATVVLFIAGWRFFHLSIHRVIELA